MTLGDLINARASAGARFVDALGQAPSGRKSGGARVLWWLWVMALADEYTMARLAERAVLGARP